MKSTGVVRMESVSSLFLLTGIVLKEYTQIKYVYT